MAINKLHSDAVTTLCVPAAQVADTLFHQAVPLCISISYSQYAAIMEDVMPVEDVGAASQPQDLPKSMATLRYRSADNPWNEETVFYILGTAHVSRSSCDDAARLIQEIRPDLVLLELCVQRQQILSLEEFKVSTLTTVPGCGRCVHPMPQHALTPSCPVQGPSLSETMTAIRTGRATPFQGMYRCE